jgi:hypothetical protein
VATTVVLLELHILVTFMHLEAEAEVIEVATTVAQAQMAADLVITVELAELEQLKQFQLD